MRFDCLLPFDTRDGGLVHVSGGVKRWHVDPGTGRCRESVPRVKRRKRRNAFWQSGADRETRYTLEPAAERHPSQGANRRTERCREPEPRVKRTKRRNGFLAIRR